MEKTFCINNKIMDRQVELDTVEEFDCFGNKTHYKSGTVEWWCEYDKTNPIRRTFADGSEEVWEYDANGKCIHSKDYHNGGEHWYKYDENGNRIYEKFKIENDTGVEVGKYWFEYDEHGRLIHEKWDDGYEHTFEYDANGKKIRSKSTRDSKNWTEYDYDDKGNIVRFKDASGYTEIFGLDYDANGNKIHSKSSTGDEYWYEYDTYGNALYAKYSDKERFYDNWLYDDGTVCKRIIYSTVN